MVGSKSWWTVGELHADDFFETFIAADDDFDFGGSISDQRRLQRHAVDGKRKPFDNTDGQSINIAVMIGGVIGKPKRPDRRHLKPAVQGRLI